MAITDGKGQQVLLLMADITAPTVVSYALYMTAGTLKLQFSGVLHNASNRS